MKLPVTIVTGFLGSGKTTLLSRLLGDPSLKNTAVLVNEFGDVGLDHHLLQRVDERTVLLGGGCVCCATRQDLVDALIGLSSMSERGEIPPLDRVVVETTGLADPAPILYTIFTDPVLQHHFEVDLVLTTVDAINGDFHLDHNPVSVKQVAAADKVVVTKTDLAKPEDAERLISRLHSINPSTGIIRSAFGDAGPGELLGAVSARRAVEPPLLEPHSTDDTQTASLTFDGPVDWAAFGIWLSMLLYARGEDVLRVKGLLDVGEAGPVVLNGVQHIIHPPRHLDEWPDEDHRSRVILIARGITREEILVSLSAFEDLLGAQPVPLSGDRSLRAS